MKNEIGKLRNKEIKKSRNREIRKRKSIINRLLTINKY
jgi:hypothetical protein